NTYHLYLRPGAERIDRLGGLHRFMSWSRGILTDSGGFQVMSLSSLRRVDEDGVTFRSHLDGSTHRLTPERAIQIQELLGSDVAMVLDECLPYPGPPPEEVEASLRRTERWAERALRPHRLGVIPRERPADRPRCLVRVGSPDAIAAAVARGVGHFGSALPTRMARHGTVFPRQGPITIKNARYAEDDQPIDPQCDCKVCR